MFSIPLLLTITLTRNAARFRSELWEIRPFPVQRPRLIRVPGREQSPEMTCWVRTLALLSRRIGFYRKTQKMCTFLGVLPELNKSQIEFQILKNCLDVCKINHIIRRLPPIPSHKVQIFDQYQTLR